MRTTILVTVSVWALLVGTPSWATAPAVGEHYSHLDWEVACDNTGTCRMAGYQPYDTDELGVSVLLKRNAGAQQPVHGALKLHYGYGSDQALPDQAAIDFWVGGEHHGQLHYRADVDYAVLSAAQVDALLSAVRTTKPYEFQYGDTRWRLSGSGMMAVLIKMDDLQQRVGTVGALAVPGTQPETAVLQPHDKPLVVMADTDEFDAIQLEYYYNHRAQAQALAQNIFAQECSDDYVDNAFDPDSVEVVPLTQDTALLSHYCWRAAYNGGYAFSLINKEFQLLHTITTDGISYENGYVEAWHKGRGLADCLSGESYAWDGTQFSLIYKGSTGMCRGALGGFWSLPVYEADVETVQVVR